jgi:hypothetical protein
MMWDLIITFAMRAAKELPGIWDAIAAGDADAVERLRLWAENQPDLKAEAKRTSDIVAAAKARLGQV